MGLPFSRFDNGNGQQNLTVFDPETSDVYVATNDHPNWDAILKGLDSGGREVLDLFDVTKVVAAKFEALSERIAVRNGRIYLDGDEVNNTLTRQILRFLDQGAGFEPLVKFYDRLAQNPNQESVEQLYSWLDSHDFTITDDGYIIGYKGVAVDPNNDGWRSKRAGTAIVNGEEITGYIPNNIGDIIEMPRSQVTFDPDLTCSQGLHIGTWEYASDWGGSNGAVLKVLVDPRDVVSVPSDHNGQKLRACRYEVLDVIEEQIEDAVVNTTKTFEPQTDRCEVCGGDCYDN